MLERGRAEFSAKVEPPENGQRQAGDYSESKPAVDPQQQNRRDQKRKRCNEFVTCSHSTNPSGSLRAQSSLNYRSCAEFGRSLMGRLDARAVRREQQRLRQPRFRSLARKSKRRNTTTDPGSRNRGRQMRAATDGRRTPSRASQAARQRSADSSFVSPQTGRKPSAASAPHPAASRVPISLGAVPVQVPVQTPMLMPR